MKVEQYVGEIVKKCFDDVKSLSFGISQGEQDTDSVNKGTTKTDCEHYNPGEKNVQAFAERLVDICLTESLEEINRHCKT